MASWKATSKLSKYTNVYQSYHEVLQAESSKPYESNLNNISDMKNSEATKQPMLPDTSTCVADHNDELSKDSVIDYVRKTDKESVHAPWDREPSRIPYKKTSSLFHKDKVIRKCMVHYLKKNVPSSSELRKCLSLAFEK